MMTRLSRKCLEKKAADESVHTIDRARSTYVAGLSTCNSSIPLPSAGNSDTRIQKIIHSDAIAVIISIYLASILLASIRPCVFDLTLLQ